MPQTSSLAVRPSFNRATTDESIIPMAHLDRRPSTQSVLSQTSDQMSPDELSRQVSRNYSFREPLVVPKSNLGDVPPHMPSPPGSPVRTGTPSRAERARDAVAAPFRADGVVHRNAALIVPYWREGLFVVTTIGMATWLGVVTGRMRALEDVPFCIVS